MDRSNLRHTKATNIAARRSRRTHVLRVGDRPNTGKGSEKCDTDPVREEQELEIMGIGVISGASVSWVADAHTCRMVYMKKCFRMFQTFYITSHFPKLRPTSLPSEFTFGTNKEELPKQLFSNHLYANVRLLSTFSFTSSGSF